MEREGDWLSLWQFLSFTSSSFWTGAQETPDSQGSILAQCPSHGVRCLQGQEHKATEMFPSSVNALHFDLRKSSHATIMRGVREFKIQT